MRELSSRPLVIGVWASLVFFGGYFAVAHLVGWHNPAPWESAIGEASRWCERVAPGAFREPVNALSNIGFMLVQQFNSHSQQSTVHSHSQTVKSQSTGHSQWILRQRCAAKLSMSAWSSRRRCPLASMVSNKKR